MSPSTGSVQVPSVGPQPIARRPIDPASNQNRSLEAVGDGEGRRPPGLQVAHRLGGELAHHAQDLLGTEGVAGGDVQLARGADRRRDERRRLPAASASPFAIRSWGTESFTKSASERTSRDDASHAPGGGAPPLHPTAPAGQRLTQIAPSFALAVAGKTVAAARMLATGSGI